MLDDFGQRIRDIILSEMDLSRELSDEEICDLIGSVVSREARDRPMTIKDRAELERTIFNSLRKLDVLQELVDDRDVTEIMVNGPNDIFYEKAGRIQRFKGHFSSEEKLEDVIQQIVGRHNRVVNQASPIVDTRLSDGSRVNIVLRRYNKMEQQLTFKDIAIDTKNQNVSKAGKHIELTPKEFELLELLMRNKNITLFREKIYEEIWGSEYSVESRTLDLHIQRLRKKLDIGDCLKTVFKAGYRLEE